ncbi:MAG: hypothetical protein H7A46_20280 [Verrucomicrobiales bacterium]|nr:hypothetical protein [Verrucomicrobiales bacterium]
MKPVNRLTHNLCLALLTLGAFHTVRADVLWTVGLDDNGWPCPGTGAGGADACFLQENGAVNGLPGDPYASDNDYYLSGQYYFTIPDGAYDPVGWFDVLPGSPPGGEENAERAFTTGDIEQRYHFNLPADLGPTDLLSVTWDHNNLDESGSDPRFGVAILVNGVEVQPQIIIRPAQLDVDYTTPAFTLESVGAIAGSGYDNVITLKGTSYSTEGGGNWMGIDYVQLNTETTILPTPVFPWTAGSSDDAFPPFVDGDGAVNDLPGSPTAADNDYYYAGSYETVIAANGTYTGVGDVPANEGSAEGRLSTDETELRYHFNLPITVQAGDLAAVSFDALELDSGGANPRFGVEVYVNGVQVGTEVVITGAELGQQITTPAFALNSVNAGFGLGVDNIVTLRGVSYTGGGNWLKLDFVRFKPMPRPPSLPWSVGRNDNLQRTDLDGGGSNASFVQENGVINPLPGIPTSPEIDGQADNDYYLAGIYEHVIAANGTYTPVGDVPRNEEAAERAFAGADNDLRYHFNLPAALSPDAPLTFSFDPISLDQSGADPRYGAEVYVNGVQVQGEVLIRPGDLNRTVFTAPFTPAEVGAEMGVGFDNIVSLRGNNYNDVDGGGNWMGFDYVRLDPVMDPPFPLDVNTDNNSHTGGAGGGANAVMVQEAGTNPPPGNPAGGEVDQASDDDYYFAGEYTTTIPGVTTMYGAYEPAGTVLVNEYAAERAFTPGDPEMRFHFNLPETLQPADQLFISYDALDLDGSGGNPQYGVEVYFNGVLVQPEQVITSAELDVDYTVGPFTLSSVGAQVGPGFDNVITLKGIDHAADGGGSWMGVDYLQVNPPPQPVFPWAVGRDDNAWPAGNGGGENATFVQEANVNAPPGNPRSPETNQQADDDYYFAGNYANTIPGVVQMYGAYTPVGYVLRNEEAAERAFAGADNELRYHFNLPATVTPSDEVVVTFDALNLDESDTNTDPRYGIEIYVNGTLVQPEIIIRPDQIDQDYSTEPFTLASVNAGIGGSSDNIVTLKGINYSADGGGNWMGIDYVKMGAPGDDTPLVFTDASVSGGILTLTWTGTGNLEAAPTVDGPWTPVSPTPASPYSEDVQPAETGRFFRLVKP